MTPQKFKVTWHDYQVHLRDMLHEMQTSEDLTDVTLVCDDDKQIKAHKVVLSACSNVFKKITKSLPQNVGNAVIYLRGIQHEDMESILEFMYLGEATCNQDRMEELLNVAKNLEIKELSKDVAFESNGWMNVDDFLNVSKNSDINDLSAEQVESDEIKSEFVDVENSGKANCELIDSDSEGDDLDSKDVLSSSVINEEKSTNDAKSNYCLRCGKEFSKLKYLKRHYINVHKPKDRSVKFQCNTCDKQFTEKRNLSTHVKSVHEGIKYHCNQCDKTFSSHANLYTHTNSAHIGLYFGCGKCDYKTSTNGNLKKHILSLKHY